MWLMLQQEKPDDYVIATGESHSLEEFVDAAFSSVLLNWRDHVVLDKALLRPTDLATGRGNPAKALAKLGWQAKHRMREVVQMITEAERNPHAPL